MSGSTDVSSVGSPHHARVHGVDGVAVAGSALPEEGDVVRGGRLEAVAHDGAEDVADEINLGQLCHLLRAAGTARKRILLPKS